MKISFLTTMFVAGFALCFADFASAQPGAGGPGGGPGGRPGLQDFGGGRGQDLFGLLRNESIQGEIELVGDQKEEIEALQEEMWSAMREKMSSVRDLEPDQRRERFAELREEMKVHQEEYQEKIQSVLLPQQLKRLKELQIQSSAQRSGRGALGILDNEDVMAELGIDEAKKEELEKKAKEVLEKLQLEIKKMRSKAEDEILSVLSSEQRRKFRDKVGESFDFDKGTQAGFGGRGGADSEGRGGAGGRGGRGGGRPENDS